MKIFKTVIGFIGEHDVGKTTATKVLDRLGFHRISINDKVEEFTNHLFPSHSPENKKQLCNQVRRRGYTVNKEYWLNLVLTSVPNNKDYIVIDDISLDEVELNKICVYHIYRPNISTIQIPKIKVISNDGSIEDFTRKIEGLYKEITTKNKNHFSFKKMYNNSK